MQCTVSGGLVFAAPMRRARYLTMLQPVEEKYGRLVVCLVYLASLCGDIFWTAAILNALGESGVASFSCRPSLTVDCKLQALVYISFVTLRAKLQALLYDILPSTTAVFSYAIGSRKLSPNEQFIIGAQTVVSS